MCMCVRMHASHGAFIGHTPLLKVIARNLVSCLSNRRLCLYLANAEDHAHSRAFAYLDELEARQRFSE